LTKLGGSNGASVESPAAARPFQTSKEKPDPSPGEADPPLKDAIDEIASTLNGMFKRGGTGG
jgi:hypothetical protein